MSCFALSFQTQLASVMEILMKAAIGEVTKIVEGGFADLQGEIDERKKENESLKLKLLVKETEWRTEHAYGPRSGAHAASRRSVGVQACEGERQADAKVGTDDGGMVEEKFVGEDWSCSLWNPVQRCGDVAVPEPCPGGFLVERAEVECIVVKEESADLEEQAVDQDCSSQQQEGQRFAGTKTRGAPESRCAPAPREGHDPRSHSCEEGWGSSLPAPPTPGLADQQGGQQGAYEGPHPPFRLEPGLGRRLDARVGEGRVFGGLEELDFVMATVPGGACGLEQQQQECGFLTPPKKKLAESKLAWTCPLRPYTERGAEGGLQPAYGEEEMAQCWQDPQYENDFHSASLEHPAKLPRAGPPQASASAYLSPPPNRSDGEDSFNHCSLCGKTFSTQWSLKTHQRVHTGERPYVCTACGRSFQNLDNLKTHQLVHTGERLFGCPLCGKRFSLLRNLKTHQRTHTGEKPYSCSQCGRTFGHLQSLETHQRIHTGEKPYSCTHCGKHFSIAQNLKTHLRIHTGEKPYCCTQCGKCFSQLGNLRTHQRTHTGERPYCCNQCGKSFSLLQNLKTHQRIHSGNRT